jgi:DNA-binding NtrC family response regulator
MRKGIQLKPSDSRHHAAGLSILILDDDTGMLRALKRVLTGEGADVFCAECSEEAVALLTSSQRCFDLIITDLWMPYNCGSGMRVIRLVRDIFPSLPILVLTAFGSPDARADCLRQGVAAFLEKPLNTTQLLNAIGEVCALPKEGNAFCQ